MFWIIIFLVSLVSAKSFAKFSCLPNSNITCIDGKRYYNCSQEDIELTKHEDALSTMIFMQNVNSYLQNNDLNFCADGYCSDDPDICLPEYKPGNECSCNNQGYACLSLTTFMYCDRNTKEIAGAQAIECPKDEVCYHIGPKKTGSPCMKASEMARSLSVHCYSNDFKGYEIVSDHTEYCNEHYPGYYLLPDKTDCSRYLYCNESQVPNFQVLHCPAHHGFNFETEKCEKTGTFSCVSRACDMEYKRISNYNRKDCKSFYECNRGHDIELVECPKGTLFDPTLQKCSINYTCPNAKHEDYVSICNKFGDTEYPLISDVKCQSYVDCYAQRPDEYNIEYCKDSEIFDFASRQCETREHDTICPNQQLMTYCEGKVGSFIAPSDYVCNVSIQCDTNPHLITPSFCQVGNFNYLTGTCDEDYECPDNVTQIRQLCVGMYKNLPDPVFPGCKYYIACRNQTFARLSCPDGQKFDPKLSECSIEYDCAEQKFSSNIGNLTTQVTNTKTFDEIVTDTTTLEETTEEEDEHGTEGEEVEEPIQTGNESLNNLISNQEEQVEVEEENKFFHVNETDDFQNFKEICTGEKNGTKLANCSDSTFRSYVQCVNTKNSKTFTRKSCPSPKIFCAELQRCTNSSTEPCSCLKEQKSSVYLPFYPFYPMKNIEYNQTCKHELGRFKLEKIAIPNPFDRTEFVICRKLNNDTVTVEWGRCCNGYEFCTALKRCSAVKTCPTGTSVKKFEYVFSLTDLAALDDVNKVK